MASGSKQRWRTILFCIVGATVFWLLNALNKVYTTEISYPVHLVVNKSKEAFTKEPPTSLTLEVTGSGWSLLRYLLQFKRKPAELTMGQVVRRGRIRNDYLRSFFDKKLKALKVNRVLLDEVPHTHTPSSRSTTQ